MLGAYTAPRRMNEESVPRFVMKPRPKTGNIFRPAPRTLPAVAKPVTRVDVELTPAPAPPPRMITPTSPAKKADVDDDEDDDKPGKIFGLSYPVAGLIGAGLLYAGYRATR